MQRKIRICLGDTDATGGIYYPSLFTFHIEMIEELLDQLGVVLAVGDQKGVGFPMRHAEADCFYPIRYGEVIEQKLILLEIGHRSITLQSRFMSGEKIVAECKAVHVHICTEQGSAVPIDAAMVAKIRAFLI